MNALMKLLNTLPWLGARRCTNSCTMTYSLVDRGRSGSSLFSVSRPAVAMGATSLGQLFTVLAISGLYRGCAIPIAWVVLPGNSPGAWKAHWLALFQPLPGRVPGDWTVLVLVDRGRYAAWLHRQIISLGWHPYLRINVGGLFRPTTQHAFTARVVEALGWQRSRLKLLADLQQQVPVRRLIYPSDFQLLPQVRQRARSPTMGSPSLPPGQTTVI